MDWEKVKIFRHVAQSKSFTHAGEKLNLSQSAISRQIKKLEEKTLDDFKCLEKKLNDYKVNIADKFISLGKQGLKIIDSLDIEHSNFSYNDLPKHFRKLIDFKKLKIGDIKFDGRLYKNLLNGILYAKSRSQEIKNAIDSVSDKLIAELLVIQKLKLLELMQMLDLLDKELGWALEWQWQKQCSKEAINITRIFLQVMVTYKNQ